MTIVSRCRHLLVPVVVVFAVSGFFAASANAGVLVSSATNCESQSLSQPFLPWADVAQYTLTPDGSFEAGAASWSLNGAAVADGNESFYVTSASDSHSLSIASGGSATSGVMCVGVEHPTLRFFARRVGGTFLSTLRVNVLYENALGLVESLPIGVVTGGSNWSVTPVYAVVANLLPLVPGERTPVAFKFTPQGGASWVIDDVYVDPWGGR